MTERDRAGEEKALAAAHADLAVMRPERNRWTNWLDVENSLYADPKNDPQRAEYDGYMRDEGIGNDSRWLGFVLSYVGRADVFGLDTPQGRQQAMKALVTFTKLIESMIRVYGDPPIPGHPSGEIVT